VSLGGQAYSRCVGTYDTKLGCNGIQYDKLVVNPKQFIIDDDNKLQLRLFAFCSKSIISSSIYFLLYF